MLFAYLTYSVYEWKQAGQEGSCSAGEPWIPRGTDASGNTSEDWCLPTVLQRGIRSLNQKPFCPLPKPSLLLEPPGYSHVCHLRSHHFGTFTYQAACFSAQVSVDFSSSVLENGLGDMKYSCFYFKIKRVIPGKRDLGSLDFVETENFTIVIFGDTKVGMFLCACFPKRSDTWSSYIFLLVILICFWFYSHWSDCNKSRGN